MAVVVVGVISKTNHKDPFLAKNYNNVLLKKDAKPSKKIPPKTKPKRTGIHRRLVK